MPAAPALATAMPPAAPVDARPAELLPATDAEPLLELVRGVVPVIAPLAAMSSPGALAPQLTAARARPVDTQKPCVPCLSWFTLDYLQIRTYSACCGVTDALELARISARAVVISGRLIAVDHASRCLPRP